MGPTCRHMAPSQKSIGTLWDETTKAGEIVLFKQYFESVLEV
jgi:hypothetical protein